MNTALKNVLERVAAWPVEDQEELFAVATEIEARRSGIYELSGAEKAAIEASRRGDLVPDDVVAAFWKRHGAA
ncbi:MAG: hypothetical protein IT537_27100 [Hyphomicrobiales bacterium]|nr:hypothetical protein [Hyphomicrobiales bacterium]